MTSFQPALQTRSNTNKALWLWVLNKWGFGLWKLLRMPVWTRQCQGKPSPSHWHRKLMANTAVRLDKPCVSTWARASLLSRLLGSLQAAGPLWCYSELLLQSLILATSTFSCASSLGTAEVWPPLCFLSRLQVFTTNFQTAMGHAPQVKCTLGPFLLETLREKKKLDNSFSLWECLVPTKQVWLLLLQFLVQNLK